MDDYTNGDELLDDDTLARYALFVGRDPISFDGEIKISRC